MNPLKGIPKSTGASKEEKSLTKANTMNWSLGILSPVEWHFSWAGHDKGSAPRAAMAAAGHTRDFQVASLGAGG